MTDGPRRMSSPAYNTLHRGYNVSSGTHGTVMPESGAVPEHIVPHNERPGTPQGAGPPQVFPGLADPTKAYFTADYKGPPQRAPGRSNEELGWGWANSAARKQGIDTGLRPRAVMHTVEAEGRIDVDRNLNVSGTEGAELTADRLRVTGTDWIRPPTSSEAGVQGTLPHINWNQHVGHTGLQQAEDYNNVGISERTGEMQIPHRNDRAEEEAMDAAVEERRLKRIHAQEPTLF